MYADLTFSLLSPSGICLRFVCMFAMGWLKQTSTEARGFSTSSPISWWIHIVKILKYVINLQLKYTETRKKFKDNRWQDYYTQAIQEDNERPYR
jgi:hypothetical protein